MPYAAIFDGAGKEIKNIQKRHLNFYRRTTNVICDEFITF